MTNKDNERLDRDRRPEEGTDCEWENILPPVCQPKRERPWDKKLNTCVSLPEDDCPPPDLSEFRSPNVARKPPPVEAPPPVYYNDEVTVSCTSGIGTVTVVEGSIHSYISVEDANSLAESLAKSQLFCKFLNTPQTASCSGSDYANEPDVVTVFTTVEGTFESYNDGGKRANDLALAFAYSQLNCYWKATVTKYCENDVNGVPSDNIDPVSGHKVPSIGVAISYANKAEAEAVATAMALDGLECFWDNEPKTVDCNNFCNELTPGLDCKEDYDLNYLDSGTASSEKGDFRSYVSKADANSMRDSYLLSQLVCYYVNNAVESSCSEGAAEGSYPGAVDAGVIISFESQDDADRQAREMAEYLSNCFFINRYREFICEDPAYNEDWEIKDSCGNIVTEGQWSSHILGWEYSPRARGYPGTYFEQGTEFYGPQPNYDPYDDSNNNKNSNANYVIVPAGTFISYDNSEQGRLDVEIQAERLGESLLDCYFENEELFHHCPVGSIPPTIPSNHSNVVIADEFDYPKGVFKGIMGATSTIATCEADDPNKFTIFSPSYYETGPVDDVRDIVVNYAWAEEGLFTSYNSPDEADAMARAYVSSLLNCQWGNDFIEAKCGFDFIYVDGSLVVDLGDGNLASGDPAHPSAKGSTSNVVIIEKNTFVSSDSRDDANLQAYALVKSLLDCYVLNEPVEALCGAKIDPVTGVFDKGTGTDGSTGAYPPSVGSIGGVDNPASVEAGLFRSYQSQLAANRQAQTLALSMLNCFWDSDPTEVKCEGVDSGVVYAEGSTIMVPLPAGIFRSFISQQDANTLRDIYGKSLLDCYFENAGDQYDCALLGFTEPGYVNDVVTVNKGLFRSYNYPEGPVEVLVTEELLAKSLLNCYYENTAEIVYDCESLFPNKEGGFADSSGGVDSAIMAGMFRSYTPNSQTQVNELERMLARSVASCYYTNSGKITYECSDFYTGTDFAGDFTTYHPEAGMVVSYHSQEDAEEIAKNIAKSMLSCYFVNEAKTYTCDDLHGAGDGTYKGYTSHEFLGGEFISYHSQEAADDIAQYIAETMLSCYFENTAEASYSCESLFGGSGYDSGSEVIQPLAGTFRSFVSEAAANDMEAAFARSTAHCYWTNDDQEPPPCPSGTSAINTSDAKIPAGSIVSYFSKADANAQAKRMSTALRVCVNYSSWSGSPGPAGPSGNCSQQCAAFYG